MSQNTPYQVLANKYRPVNFDHLIGQETLVQTLTNAIASNRIANAFLLTGIRGIGKTTTARIIARALNCVGTDGNQGPTASPCGVCDQCTSIKDDNHPDVLEIDAASRTGVDDIREIIDNANYLPTVGRYKIYIIDEVHMLSKNAFNALLKTLEEPPQHVKFIFATTEIRKIPITILSRCQRFDLKRIEHKELADHLANIAKQEGIEASPEALSLIAHASEGSVRDALSILDQAIILTNGSVGEEPLHQMLGLADQQKLFSFFEHISSSDISNALEIYQQLYRNGTDPIQFTHDLLDLIHFLTKLKLPANLDFPDKPSDVVSSGKTLSEKLSVSFLTRCWQLVSKALPEIQYAPDSFAAVEMLLIRLSYMASLPSPEKVIQTLKNDRSTATAAPVENKAPTHQVTEQEPPTAAIETPTPTPAEPIAAPIEAANNNKIDTFEDFVELFKQHGELLVYSWLMNDVEMLHFENGKLECVLSDTIPPDFSKKLTTLLQGWTGKKWQIIVSKGTSANTLNAQKEEAQKAFEETIIQEDNVQEVLGLFPGAEVKEIKEIGE
jgi:DNA polymerase-3 subunit gamma/tau